MEIFCLNYSLVLIIVEQIQEPIIRFLHEDSSVTVLCARSQAVTIHFLSSLYIRVHPQM